MQYQSNSSIPTLPCPLQIEEEALLLPQEAPVIIAEKRNLFLCFQIEEEAVLLLTSLLKLAEAPARAQLQRVLLNLCAHPESRKQVMQILMSMLRAPLSADEAAEASQVSLHCSLLPPTNPQALLNGFTGDLGSLVTSSDAGFPDLFWRTLLCCAK